MSKSRQPQLPSQDLKPHTSSNAVNPHPDLDCDTAFDPLLDVLGHRFRTSLIGLTSHPHHPAFTSTFDYWVSEAREMAAAYLGGWRGDPSSPDEEYVKCLKHVDQARLSEAIVDDPVAIEARKAITEQWWDPTVFILVIVRRDEMEFSLDVKFHSSAPSAWDGFDPPSMIIPTDGNGVGGGGRGGGEGSILLDLVRRYESDVLPWFKITVSVDLDISE